MPLAAPYHAISDLEHVPEEGSRSELLDGVLLVTPAPGLPRPGVLALIRAAVPRAAGRATCAALLLALASSRAASQSPDDASEIRRRRESSNAAIARHDTAGLGAILAPHFTITSSTSRHDDGRDAHVRSFAEQFRTRPDVVYRRTPDDVRVFGPWQMASERGRWTGFWTDTDGTIRIGGSYFAKWRKLGGQWFVESETYVPETCTGGAYCTRVP